MCTPGSQHMHLRCFPVALLCCMPAACMRCPSLTLHITCAQLPAPSNTNHTLPASCQWCMHTCTSLSYHAGIVGCMSKHLSHHHHPPNPQQCPCERVATARGTVEVEPWRLRLHKSPGMKTNCTGVHPGAVYRSTAGGCACMCGGGAHRGGRNRSILLLAREKVRPEEGRERTLGEAGARR